MQSTQTAPGISPNEIWNLPLPPLAVVNNQFPPNRDLQSHCPIYLKDAVDPIYKAVSAGTHLIILDSRHRANNQDLRILLDFGILKLPEAKHYELVTHENAGRFIDDVWKAEQRTSDSKLVLGNKRGIILILTEDINQAKPTFGIVGILDKASRVFGDSIQVIRIPESDRGTLVEQHSDFALKAESGTFRDLFVKAGSNPVTGFVCNPGFRRSERFVKPLPKKDGKFGVAQNQEEAFDLALKLTQYMLYAHKAPSLFIHGPHGNGKTTLLSALGQTLTQLGQPTEYVQFTRQEKLDFTGARREFPFVMIDQVEHIPHSAAVENPFLNRAHRGLIMTSNRPPKEYGEHWGGLDLPKGRKGWLVAQMLSAKILSQALLTHSADILLEWPGESWATVEAAPDMRALLAELTGH